MKTKETKKQIEAMEAAILEIQKEQWEAFRQAKKENH